MSDISKGGSAEEAGDPTCKSLKHPRIEKVSLCNVHVGHHVGQNGDEDDFSNLNFTLKTE